MAKKKRKGKLVRLTGDELKELKNGPIRHPTGLDPFLTVWARVLFNRVGYHLYPAFEKWELGFMRDAHPGREMFVWEGIARAYEAYLSDHPQCDSQAIVGNLAVISSGGGFEQETEETENLRTVFRNIWKRMIEDTDATLKEVRQSLGDD